MIPDFDEGGNLPPGIHRATWDELVARYGTSARRLSLLAGLKKALDNPKGIVALDLGDLP